MKTESPAEARRIRTGDYLRVRHLRLLELIERGGSLSHAARVLHLSQPAVTKMLHELEAVFGPALVQRGPGGGQLTPQGRATLARLRRALGNFDAALQERGQPLPTLRIGLLPLAAVALLPRALQRLSAQPVAPRLLLREGTVTHLLDQLLAGRLDGVIGRLDAGRLSQADRDGLRCAALAEEQLVVAASPQHPLVRRRRVALATHAAQPRVLASTGSHTRQQFDAAFIGAGLMPPLPDIESLSFHSNAQLVAASQRLTLMPATAALAYERVGLVRRVHAEVEFRAAPLSFVTLLADPELPALAELRDALVAAARMGVERGLR